MNISLFGCGWLGQALAQSLSHKQHQVIATKRTQEGCNAVKAQGIHAVPFSLGAEIETEYTHSLFGADVAIINIAAGRKSLHCDVYTQNMASLVRQLHEQHVENLVFISTTSVFGEQGGAMTELSSLAPVTESGRAHVLIEKNIREIYADQATILRLAGLVGEDRHPARYLSGKQNLANPTHPVNLVHRDDVTSAVVKIIENNIWGHTLHLSAIEHPTRSDYYRWAAQRFNIELPCFIEDEGTTEGKIIECEHSLSILGLELAYPSPYDMV